MEKAQASVQFVRMKAEQLEIPFPNLLAGFAAEKLLQVIADSFYGDHFIMKSRHLLGLDVYKKEVVHRLDFFYDGMLDCKNVQVVFDRIFEKENKNGYSFRHLFEEEEGGIQAEITVSLGEWNVPFSFTLTKWTEDKTFLEQEFALFAEQGVHIHLFVYGPEAELAELIAEILYKLELIDQMEFYDKANQMLRTESINGRIMKDKLKSACEERHFTPDENRISMWRTYRDYSYMEKKWKRYERAAKSETKEWTQMIDRMNAFLTPLCAAITADEVFFKDWMPELERYL